jgi:hypothetical protein
MFVVAGGVALISRGDSKPRVATGPSSASTTPPAGPSTTAPPQPLADIPLTSLVPVVAKLDTGLQGRTFSTNGKRVLEITDPETLISASNTPKDDRALYTAHRPKGFAGAGWASLPSTNTQIQLTMLKFATPADALAVRTRMREQEEQRLEQLLQHIQDPVFETRDDPALGRIDVLQYFDPQGRPARPNTKAPTGALVVRYLGTRGQYLFEVSTLQIAGANRQLVAPVVDAAPSAREVLRRLAETMDAKFNPRRNP